MTQTNGTVDPGSDSSEGAADPSSFLDFEALDGLRELRTPGEPDPLAELIDLFLEDTPPRLAKLQESFQAGDAAEVERAAHSLKGSAGNLGAKSLSEVCLIIMTTAREGRLPEAGLVERAAFEFRRLKPALEAQKNS